MLMKMQRNWNHHTWLVVRSNGANTLENSLAVSQTFRQRIIIVPAIPLLDIYLRKVKNRYSKKYFCICIVGLFTIAKR